MHTTAPLDQSAKSIVSQRLQNSLNNQTRTVKDAKSHRHRHHYQSRQVR
jgi:hypothetical protein